MKDNIEYIIENEYYVFILMILTVIFFLYEKKIGLFISIYAFITSWYLNYTDLDYNYQTLIKIYLVIIPTIIMFLQLNNIIKFKYINSLLRFALQANIAALLFRKTNIYVVCGLIFSVLTAPYIIVNNDIINMKPYLINPSIWVIISTLAISSHYITYIGWKERRILALFCILIPTITHFLFNEYLTIRGLLLCCLFLFDLIDKKNKGF